MGRAGLSSTLPERKRRLQEGVEVVGMCPCNSTGPVLGLHLSLKAPTPAPALAAHIASQPVSIPQTDLGSQMSKPEMITQTSMNRNPGHKRRIVLACKEYAYYQEVTKACKVSSHYLTQPFMPTSTTV